MAISNCINKVEKVRFKGKWEEMEEIALDIPRERAYRKMTQSHHGKSPKAGSCWNFGRRARRLVWPL